MLRPLHFSLPNFFYESIQKDGFLAVSARGQCKFRSLGVLNSVLGKTSFPHLDNIAVDHLHVVPSLTWGKETMEQLYLLWCVSKKVFLHHKYKLIPDVPKRYGAIVLNKVNSPLIN